MMAGYMLVMPSSLLKGQERDSTLFRLATDPTKYTTLAANLSLKAFAGKPCNRVASCSPVWFVTNSFDHDRGKPEICYAG